MATGPSRQPLIYSFWCLYAVLQAKSLVKPSPRWEDFVRLERLKSASPSQKNSSHPMWLSFGYLKVALGSHLPTAGSSCPMAEPKSLFLTEILYAQLSTLDSSTRKNTKYSWLESRVTQRPLLQLQRIQASLE